MGKKRRRKRESWLAQARRLADMRSAEAMYRQAMIHVNCQGELEVENCKGILLYNETELLLDMGELCARIRGTEMMVDAYHQKLLTVRGRIFSLELIYERPAGNEVGR